MPEPRGSSGERSIAAVMGDIAGNLQQIVRAEIRLAKAEAGHEVATLRRVLIYWCVAGVAALFGVGYLLLTGVYALALWMPAWAAALCVAAPLVLLALGCGMAGARSLKMPSMPRTSQAVKESLSWTKQ